MDRKKRLIDFPFAREGLAFMALSLVCSIVLFFLKIPIVPYIGILFFLFCLFFFRNPKRIPNCDIKDELISPADGKVMDIREIEEGEFLKERATRVSIFMSLADVHVNRAPCSGIVAKVLHRDGEFALAFRKDIDKDNERNYVLIENDNEKILVVQIAGFLARRITSYVKEGVSVKKGDPIGIIAFGSRVDIYFPQNYKTMVSLNSRTKAGMTLIAKRGT